MRVLNRFFVDEDEEDRRIAAEEQPVAAAVPAASPIPLYWTAGLIVIGLPPRLIYIFLVSNPENAGDGWYGDTYHHWQIAYLTKEVGLTAPGGPRLWDLKGLEYFWGVLQPLLLVGLFYVTNYVAFIADHPSWFEQVARFINYNWVVYQVGIPKPVGSDCAAAKRAAPA